MRKLAKFVGEEAPSKIYQVSGRTWVARSPTLTVMEFTLAPGEEVPLHYHSDCYDIFYCIEGRMNVECVDPATGEKFEETVLGTGDSAKVETGIAHRPYNPYQEQARFVIIQGFGHKDFILFDNKH